MSRVSKNVINWRRRTKEKIVKAMGGECQICHYNKCNDALELHHLNPKEKELSFGKIRANPVAIQKVIIELRKCILLCSNCHKEVHAGLVCIPSEYKVLDESIFDKETKDVSDEKVKRRENFKKEKIWKQKIFLTNQEVFDILNSEFDGNKSKMADSYGVSEAAIRKRLNKLMLP